MTSRIDPGTVAVNAVGAICLAIPVAILVWGCVTYGFNPAAVTIIGVIELALILAVLYWVPLYADVEDGVVYVRYVARKSKLFSVDEIVDVRYVEKVHPAYLFCAGFGNRGFFGVAAYCMEIKNIGPCYFYSRRSRDLILITLRDGRKYLLAPRDPREFMERLLQHSHTLSRYGKSSPDV